MLRLFSGLRIGARLSGAFLLVAVIGGAIGAFGVWGLSRINELNDRLYDTELRGISDMKEANINLIYAGRARNGYLAASSDQDRQALKKQFDDAVKNMDALREKAAVNFHAEEGKRLLAQFAETEQVWKRESAAFFAAAQSQSLTQTDPRVAEIEKRVIVSSQKLDDLMTDLAVSKEKVAAQSVQEGTDLYDTCLLYTSPSPRD